MLEATFDEDRIVKYITKAFWQLPSSVNITDNTGNNFADKEGLKRVIEKWYPDEPYKEIIVDVIRNQEPTVKDIENEFWANCPDEDKINKWCDIYWERFKDHLKIYEEDFYKAACYGSDKENALYPCFQDLRLTGLLKVNVLFVEARIWHIAQNLNNVTNKLTELFQGLRRIGQEHSDNGSQDHSDLFKALSTYFTGINLSEFNNIIEHHSLTQNAQPAAWVGSKADACRFADHFNMEIPKFNKCFSFADGKKLRHGDRNQTGSPIKKLLEEHGCK